MKRLVSILMLLVSLLGYSQTEHTANHHQCPACYMAKNMKFAWGGSLTGTVDLSGNDMSTLGMDLYCGIKLPVMEILGGGVELNIPVSNSHRLMPVYVIARTNFSTRPRLLFMDVRSGLSFNEIENGKIQTGAYASAGIGFNLARRRTFSSHLILSYSFFERRDYIKDDALVKLSSIHGATLRLGITF